MSEPRRGSLGKPPADERWPERRGAEQGAPSRWQQGQRKGRDSDLGSRAFGGRGAGESGDDDADDAEEVGRWLDDLDDSSAKGSARRAPTTNGDKDAA
jgi:hypothetical protein